VRPALAWKCASSESGRKRLQARSMASVSARRMRSASSARDGSGTTTVAVVPKARKDRVAMQDCADASVDVLTSATWRPRWRQEELSSWWAARWWW
jgi:hypothetical protein